MDNTVLTLLASLFAAAASLFGWLRSRETAAEVRTVRLEINSRFTELLRLTGAEGEAKGRADEKADAAERQAS